MVYKYRIFTLPWQEIITLFCFFQNLGSCLVASLPYQAINDFAGSACAQIQGTSRNWFRTNFWGSI